MEDRRTQAAWSYLEARVRGASGTELVSLLFEALVREMRGAAEAIDRRDVARKGSAIGRCLDIIGHLRTCLDHSRGGEIATNLERLYVYWTLRLTDANVASERKPLDEVIGQLENVRSAWNRAAAGAAPAEPAATAASGLAAATGGRTR